jgi:hypothetical protein
MFDYGADFFSSGAVLSEQGCVSVTAKSKGRPHFWGRMMPYNDAYTLKYRILLDPGRDYNYSQNHAKK